MGPGPVRELHDGVADYHSCVEHLEVAVWELGSVTIAIRAVDCEVVGTTPHAPRAELHVEAFFALIDKGRRCSPCAVV